MEDRHLYPTGRQIRKNGEKWTTKGKQRCLEAKGDKGRLRRTKAERGKNCHQTCEPKGNKDTQMETKQKTTQPCRETNAETKRRQRPKEMDTPNKIQEASEGRQRRKPPMLGDE